MKYLTRIVLLIAFILYPVLLVFAQDEQVIEEKQRPPSQSQQQEGQKAVSTPEEHNLRVGRIFVRLINVADIDRKVDYQMVKGSEPNAFAAPLDAGKYKFDYVVAVSYGMVAFVQSDDELAVVIGHELAHIAKGHIESKSTRRTVGAVLGGLASIAVGVVTGGAVIPNLVGTGSKLGAIVYSKEQETEADHSGIVYAYKAGFNPEAGVAIWERYVREIPESDKKSILATHPASSERMARMKTTVEEIKADGLGKYTEAIEANPTYEAPYLARASEYLRFGRYEDAIHDCDKAIELNPDSHAAYLHRAIANARLKINDKAIEDMRHAADLGSKPAQGYLTQRIIYW
jgi:Zn-dependent protease with chaperone function